MSFDIFLISLAFRIQLHFLSPNKAISKKTSFASTTRCDAYRDYPHIFLAGILKPVRPAGEHRGNITRFNLHLPLIERHHTASGKDKVILLYIITVFMQPHRDTRLQNIIVTAQSNTVKQGTQATGHCGMAERERQ